MTLDDSSWPSTKLLFSAMVISLGGSGNYCFQMILTNPAQQAFLNFVNGSYYQKNERYLELTELETMWSPIVSILYWGTILGSLLIEKSISKFGRKHALTMANCGQAFGIALGIMAYFLNDFILYAISRFFLGIFQAISLGVGPMYILECSPAKCRGVISTSTALAGQLGIIVSAILAMPVIWGNVNDWWKLYVAELIFTIALIFVSLFFPESPVVLQNEEKILAAERSIKFYHGVTRDEAKHLLNTDKGHPQDGQQRAIGLFEIFANPISRWGTLVGGCVMFAHVFSGITVVQSFAVDILMNTGLSMFAATSANVFINTMPLFGIFLSSYMVEKLGRRPLELFGILALILVNTAVVALLYGYDTTKNMILGWSLVVVVAIFAVTACTTVVPLSFFLPAELVAPNVRPQAMTWFNLMMATGRSLLLAIFLPMKLFFGAAITYGILFIPTMILAFFILYSQLPETKGRTFEETISNRKTRANYTTRA
ncbi:unnamed protein product, partial [Mesorhabditis belari]